MAGRKRAQRDVQQQRWRHTSATGSHSDGKLYGCGHADRSRHSGDVERRRKYAFKRAVYVDADHESRRSSGLTGNAFIDDDELYRAHGGQQHQFDFSGKRWRKQFHYSRHGNCYGADCTACGSSAAISKRQLSSGKPCGQWDESHIERQWS